MRIQALYDLQNEINRLYIAGSKFAKGDPRLSKHLPLLQKLGEKAPVFKKLAQDIEELINIDSKESSDKLLNIGILLYSILYTQGETSEDIPTEVNTPYYNIDNVNTTASYLSLKPVIEALTTSKSGRLEVLQDAFAQGVFKDFRTFEFLDTALGDKYSELAEYVEKAIIPSVGQAILPFIKGSFSLEGKTQDVRRLRLMQQLGEPNLASLVEESLNSTSVNLQTEAIRMLGDDVKNESRIMLYAEDKNKQVREAAYLALSQYNTENSREKLNQLFLNNKNKSHLAGIVNALALLPNLSENVFEKIVADFDNFIEKAPSMKDKDFVNEFEKLQIVFNILEGKQDLKVLIFIEKVLLSSQFKALVKEKANLVDQLGEEMINTLLNMLKEINIKETISVYEKVISDKNTMKLYGSSILVSYFSFGVKMYSPEKIYDTFCEYYSSDKIRSAVFFATYAKSNYSQNWLLQNLHTNNNAIYYFDILSCDYKQFDPRWIDLFITKSQKKATNNNQESILAFYLALFTLQAEDTRLYKLISSKLAEYTNTKVFPNDIHYLFKRMVDINYPDSANIILTEIENKAGQMNAGYNYYTFIAKIRHFMELGIFQSFPKEYAERVQKLYDTLEYDIFWDVLNLVKLQSK